MREPVTTKCIEQSLWDMLLPHQLGEGFWAPLTGNHLIGQKKLLKKVARHPIAHGESVTVASFRTWRDSQVSHCMGPDHWPVYCIWARSAWVCCRDAACCLRGGICWGLQLLVKSHSLWSVICSLIKKVTFLPQGRWGQWCCQKNKQQKVSGGYVKITFQIWVCLKPQHL